MKGFKTKEGVQCESCHGAGSEYRNPSVMSARKFKADPVGTKKIFIENGLIVPTEETCIKCHNKNSPTFVEFNFAEMVAKIAHPNPKNKK